ncbi:hypothetical protein FV288_10775 [Escherichia coli]|nr:hypothetical protein FV288_10775 [Escherichia coli]
MSCGVSGCDIVVASGKKNGQGVTTLPIFFKTEKITSSCNYAPTQSPRQPCRPAAPPESR